VKRSIIVACLVLAGCSEQPESGSTEPETPDFDYPLDDSLQLQHLQALSTHNSYHVEKDDNDLAAWAYTHLPLDAQLDVQGVRHMELDLRYDWALERFAVYHLPIIDEVSTCDVFTDCLQLVADWSTAHPAHHLVVLQLELKDGLAPDPDDYFARLHDEIASVFDADQLLTPQDARGDHASLGEAIATDGWPTLGELRGRVMFTMDNGGDVRDAYTHGGVHVTDRTLFPSSAPGDPYAAIAVLNDPLSGAAAIAEAISANMLVRTRADADNAEAQANDTTRRDAALTSGAHFVTTDFPAAIEGMDYFVSIPDGTPSRCNPVTAPPACTSLAIEDPSFLD